jgi:hypothetical protein
MTREDLLRHHTELCEKAKAIMVNKNHDYTGNQGNSPFANFERCEAMGLCSTEVGLLVRVTDKVSRLSTFANCGKLKVENESYEDAILDIINYCILLSGIVKTKQKRAFDLTQK